MSARYLHDGAENSGRTTPWKDPMPPRHGKVSGPGKDLVNFDSSLLHGNSPPDSTRRTGGSSRDAGIRPLLPTHTRSRDTVHLVRCWSCCTCPPVATHQKITLCSSVLRKLSLLFSCCTVVAAAVAYIAPVRPDPDARRLALLTYRAIVFHVGRLLEFLFHGD